MKPITLSSLIVSAACTQFFRAVCEFYQTVLQLRRKGKVQIGEQVSESVARVVALQSLNDVTFAPPPHRVFIAKRVFD